MKKHNFLINYLELKQRSLYVLISFFISFIISFEHKTELLYLISNKFITMHGYFIYTGVLDILYVYIQLSLIISIFLTLPQIFYHSFVFILKSVFDIYKYLVILWLSVFTLLNYFIYKIFNYYCLNMLFTFLLEYQRIEKFVLQIYLEATITQYVRLFIYALYFSLFTVIFPLLLFIFIFMNYFKRKIIYLITAGFFIAVAPPDFLIQISILPFLIFIIEMYIYFSFFFLVLYKTVVGDSQVVTAADCKSVEYYSS